VYKHAISTVMPGAPIQLFDAPKTEGTASTLTIAPRETAAAGDN
jgi:host factor-I protein